MRQGDAETSKPDEIGREQRSDSIQAAEDEGLQVVEDTSGKPRSTDEGESATHSCVIAQSRRMLRRANAK